ncbi:ADP-glyceromanno-heptose 6-epimerase [bacterium]|nr:ADP-glyceromanno-heptose 6-epimerase [bacterium]
MIAVTGAAGFIGSNIVHQLNQAGRKDIIVVDLAPEGGRGANLSPLEFVRYLDKEAFRTWLAEPANAGSLETLYHMGACSSTTETDWDYLAENNLGYTRELCLRCLDAGVRFINASSAATYGDGSRGYADDHALLETLEPLNLYGKSKHDFDLWAKSENLLESIVCLKYFNVYGPNEWHKGDMRSMVCKGYEQIRDQGKVRLFRSDRPDFPDGGQQRDFVYVKDAVAMTLWFADHPEAGGVFNVGTGEANSWNRLITAIFAAMGREPDIEYVPMPDHLKGRYQYFTRAEMDKIRSAGYDSPVTVLEDAVADYVRNHLVPGRHLGS